MRRLLAFMSFGNAMWLSHKQVDWKVVAVFLAVALIMLGLTTVQEIKALTQYRIADAVGGASVEGETEEPIGFKGC